MSKCVAIIVHGAGGRMGQAVLRLATAREDLRVVAALGRADAPDAAGPDADVLVDFSGAEGFDRALSIARDRRIAFVSGSTGLGAAQFEAIEQAASSIPLLWAANFSLGVAVLAHLVGEAARLVPDWDCEIVEAHHRHKRDAPSGTALMLGRSIDEARGQPAAMPITTRAGTRAAGSTGYAVVRGGDIVGEHEVLLIGNGERLELGHRASDRDIFARGALAAASWIGGRAAGRYTLADVLALR